MILRPVYRIPYLTVEQPKERPVPDLAKPDPTPETYRVGMTATCTCGDPLFLTGELPGMTYWMHVRSGSIQCRMDAIPEEALTDWARDILHAHESLPPATCRWCRSTEHTSRAHDDAQF